MKKKPRSIIVTAVISLVAVATFVASVVTYAIFMRTGTTALATVISDELVHRAEYLADISSSYLEGHLTPQAFRKLIGDGYGMWDASTYGFNSYGNIFIRPSSFANTQKKLDMAQAHLPEVMSGIRVVDSNGLVIGEPIINEYGKVIGGIFLVKPLSELGSTFREVRFALLTSVFFTFLVMAVPTIMLARELSRPIKSVTEVATVMANGNLDARVQINPHSNNELSNLGKSLNNLSSSLSHVIDDLTLERNRLRSILYGMSDGVIALDRNRRIVIYNPAVVRLLGELSDLKSSESEVMTKIIASTAELSEENNYTVVMTETVGEATLKIVISSPPGMRASQIPTLIMIRDITEAERYEQARKDYVANVSHELRTPLAAIRSITDMLNDGLVKTEEDRKKYYNHMLKEEMRLSRLINDLLELSRLQSGTLVIERRMIDMTEIILDTVDRYTQIAQESGINIITELPEEELPQCYSNADRAEQVLIIILDNAIKYSESDTVKLRVDVKPTELIISVSNAATVNNTDLPHLFDRFYKVDKAHTGKGTGLGLSIASEVMHILGERIWVESENGIVTFSFTVSTVRA